MVMLTPANLLDLYEGTVGLGCKFGFKFKLITPSNTLINSYTLEGGTDLKLISQIINGNIAYIVYDYKMNVGIVTFPGTITNSLLGMSTFNISLTCSSIPIAEIVPKSILGKFYYISPQNYFTAFRFTGFKKQLSNPIQYSMGVSNLTSYAMWKLIKDYTGTNDIIFRVNMVPMVNTFELYKSFNFTIKFNGKEFEFYVPPYILLGQDPAPTITFSSTTGLFSSAYVEYTVQHSTFDSVGYTAGALFNDSNPIYNYPVLGNPTSAVKLGRGEISRIIGVDINTAVTVEHFNQIILQYKDVKQLDTITSEGTLDSSMVSPPYCGNYQTSSILSFQYRYIKIVNSFWSSNIYPSKPAPYGHCEGNLQSFVYSIQNFPTQTQVNSSFIVNGNQMTYCLYSTYDYSPPTINQMTVRRVSPTSSIWVVRFNIISQISGFSIIYYTINDMKYIIADCSNIESGTFVDGTLEFKLNSSKQEILALRQFTVLDNAGKSFNYKIGNFENYNEYLSNNFVTVGNFTYFKFHTPKVIYNEQVTATNVPKPFKNTLYFNFTYRNDELPLSLSFPTEISVTPTEYFPSYWDDSIKMYRIDFEIPYNFFTQELNYQIVNPTSAKGVFELLDTNIIEYSDILSFIGSNAILSIESTNADQMPPLVKQINGLVNQHNTDIVVEFQIIIEDLVNGFDRGLLQITSNYDPIGYKFNLNTTDVFTPEFSVSFTLNSLLCRNQDFSISYIELYDRMGRKSVYDSMTTRDTGINPMYRIINESQVASVTQCTSTDTTTPTITSIGISSPTDSAFVTFEFTIQDSGSGFDALRTPICYLITTFDREINIVATCNFPNTNNLLGNCQCKFLIPYMFGYPDGMIPAIHGIYDRSLNFNGYVFRSLVNINASLGSKIESKSFNFPYIFGVEPYYNNQNQLTIKGRNFENRFVILTDVASNIEIGIFEYILITNTTIIVSLDTPILKPFTIVAMPPSNIITYTPLVPVLVPTIPPGNCLSDCGSLEQGTCTNNGCKCILPWFGDDCRSRVINTTTPQTNTTSPTTEQEYEEELPTGEKINLSTLISIVGLRELDVNGKSIQEYTFKDWIYTNVSNLNETKYLYSTNITRSLGQGLPNYITTIDVSTKWFTSTESITFAGETFKISPSTMKYSVSMSSYPFKSHLSKLQLIFSASIQSKDNNEVICSSKQFKVSDNTEIESEYIKLSLNSHSLFGRFIKRAVIDDRITVIDNQLINSSESNLIPEKSESLIAINIPFYNSFVSLDPDFSLLIDSSSNKDDDNSICSSPSSRGLTKGQLAGIIIGSVCGFLVISIIVGFFIYKKVKYSNWYLNMKEKMKRSKENRKSVELRKRSIAPVFFGGKVQEVDKF